MEEQKTCSICEKTKHKSEYLPNSTFCRACHNDKRRNKYKKESKEPEQIVRPKLETKISDLFFDRLLQLQQFTYANGVKDINGLQDKLDELQNILDKIRDNSEVLVFKIKVSSKLTDFLGKAYSNGFDLKGSWNMLCGIFSSIVNKHNNGVERTVVHFKEVYNMDPCTLFTEVWEEFKDLSCVVAHIEHVYMHMVDYYQDTYQGDVSSRIHVTSNMLRTTFNPYESEIVLNNPLRYDLETFWKVFKIVTGTKTAQNLGLHGIIDEKYPEKFLKIIL